MATAASATRRVTGIARTKERMCGPRGRLVVADTQFAQQRWLDDTPIEAAVQATLAPFNHVRVGTGYPDLVGVQTLSTDLLSVDRLGDRPPLIAIEAKGFTGNGGVDAERGVVQAHDRLNEANVAFLTAPRSGISTAARTMARELTSACWASTPMAPSRSSNGPAWSATERWTPPRRSGSRPALGSRRPSAGLDHPKNYIAVPLAVHHEGDTRDLLASHVVRAVDGALAGAAFRT